MSVMTSATPTLDTRLAGRIIGGLVLVAFLLYGFGALLLDHPIGRAMVVTNSVVVWAIGLTAYVVLRDRDPVTGMAYLATRLLEGALLAGGAAMWVLPHGEDANTVAFCSGMIALGSGSVLVFRRLISLGWVPAWLGWWGVLGYACMVLGCLLELLEVVSSLGFMALGGSFEVVLGLLLLARGFPLVPSAERD